MRDFHQLLMSSEVRDLNDEVRRLFQDLEQSVGQRHHAPPGECTPSLDVLETDETVEILVDLPGISARDVRILIQNGVVVIAGEKLPPEGRPEGSFHLVERGFGRFARAVRLSGAFHTGRARAELAGGELRIVIPKIAERRGQEIMVPVEQAAR